MASFSESFIADVESAIANNDLNRLDGMAAAYFQAAGHGPSPYSAAVELSEAGRQAIFAAGETVYGGENESAQMLDAANFVERGRRLIKYKKRKFTDPQALRIVAEGDSWFQYPFFLTDVIDVLIEKYAVCCLSAGGDTVANMVRWPEYLDAIEQERPAVFLFSGGGNDLVGDGRLRQILKPYTAGAQPQDLIDSNAFGQILRQVVSGYEQILKSLKDRFPGLRMLGHGYDHPQNISAGPWIKPYLEEAKIPLSMGPEIIAVLLDRFGDELVRLSMLYPNFEYISVVGKVGGTAADWHDALHPKNPGYRRVANAFIESIEAARDRQPAYDTRESFTGGDTFADREGAPFEERRRTYSLPSVAYPEWFDFGPEGNWIEFDDPKVHQHIREAISLLERRDQPEDREIVRNRLHLAPVAHVGSGLDLADFDLDAQAEAIIGSNDLEDIQTLMVGYKTSRAVGLIALRTASGMTAPQGSGFLVGPDLLLTNNHVLKSPAQAAQHVLIMDDERDLLGNPKPVQRFRITSEVFVTDEHFDFSFASVEPVSHAGAALASYGGLRLEELPGKAIKHEPLCIIQHPSGGPKSISIRNSHAMGRVDEGFYYTSDTQKGSSGSAVLSRDWQLVALHHRAVPHPTIRGEYIANRGIRVSAIIGRLAEMSAGGNAQAGRVLKLLAAPGKYASDLSFDAGAPAPASTTAAGDSVSSSADSRPASRTEKLAAKKRAASKSAASVASKKAKAARSSSRPRKSK